MADERKVIYLEINASKAVDGSLAATRALERIERSTAAADSSLSKIEQSLGRVGGYLKAQLAFMVAEAAGSLLQMAKDALNAAANMGELADQMGVSVKGLQALQFAAAQNNVKFEQLETGIAKFSQRIGEAAAGNKPMIEALDKLGVKILDSNGKLRQNEVLIEEVAAAILKIEDPAKRAAASIDFFSRSGAKFQPMLQSMASGFAEMGAAAQKAGAIISADAITKLDKLADRGEVAKLQMRALFAENAADPLTKALDFIIRKVENLSNVIGAAKGHLSALLLLGQINPFLTLGAVAGASLASTEKEKLASELAARQSDVADMQANLARATSERDIKRMQTALDRANAELVKAQRQVDVASVAGKTSANPSDPDNIGVYVTPNVPKGVKNPLPEGAGKAAEDAAKKYDKLTIQLQETARAQDVMTAAARNGDVAFEEAKVHLDAVQKTLEIFGKRLADNDPLLVELEARLLRISRGEVAKAFNVATTQLEKQNELLALQNRLMSEAPEIQAREIALLKTKHEAEKAGASLPSSDKQRRLDALEAGEQLKIQGEELKRSQELWTAPFQRALENIQSTSADWIDTLLQGLEKGKLSFADFGQAGIAIIRRMVSEILSLAIIRPMLGGVVNGLADIGVIGQSTARQLGYGGSTAGGLGGMPSLGGGGGLGGWFNSPISGNLPSGQFGPPAPGQGFSSGFLGDLTWGQAFGVGGGLLSMGLGANTLLSGKGGIGSTIGGIGGLLGGGLGIAGALMPAALGGMLGPIGMGVGLLASFLPGLLGGEEKKPPKLMATGGLNFNAGKWNYNGSEYNGGSGLGGALGGVGGTMKSLMDAAGVTSLTSGNSLNFQTLSQGEFSNATTFVNGQQWGQSSDNDAGLDTAAAHIAHKIMMEVDSGISQFMREGLGKYGLKNLDHAFSTEELGVAVTELKGLETILKDLGRTIPEAETALKAIDDQFKALKDTAEKYDLDTTKIVDEQAKARTKVGTDFADSIQRALDDQSGNTSKGLLADLEKEKQAAIAENTYIVANVTDALDQINKIEKLYGDKRVQIVAAAQKSYTDTVIQLRPAENQATYAYYQSTKQINDTFAAFYANAELLGLTVEQISADFLAAYTQLGEAHEKQLAAEAFGKFQFFDSIAQQRQAIDDPAGAMLTGLARSRDLTVKTAQDQWGIGSPEHFQATIDAYGLYTAQVQAANDNFRAGLDAMTRELEGAGVANIKNLMDARAKDIATAGALDGPYFDGILRVGANVEAAMKAWNAKIARVADDFAFSISQGLLEFSDPLQAAINENNKQRDEAIATGKANNNALSQINAEISARGQALDDIRVNDEYAIRYTNELAAKEKRALTDSETLNIQKWNDEIALARSAGAQVAEQLAAMGNHYVSMADITELYLKKEQQLKEQYYAQALSGLEDIIKRLTYGDLSGASPTLTLAGTKGAYQATLAQAMAGDQTALQNLSGVAAEYVTEGRNFFASSTDYFRIVEEVRAALQTIDTAVRGGTTATNGSPTPSPSEAANAELVKEMLIAMRAMMAQQEETNALLKRAVVYS